MPHKTMEAAADHGEIPSDSVTGTYAESQQVLDNLERVGVSYAQVVETLETEGVEKFVGSWKELLETVQGELDRLGGESR
jgi:transaldolase